MDAHRQLIQMQFKTWWLCVFHMHASWTPCKIMLLNGFFLNLICSNILIYWFVSVNLQISPELLVQSTHDVVWRHIHLLYLPVHKMKMFCLQFSYFQVMEAIEKKLWLLRMQYLENCFSESIVILFVYILICLAGKTKTFWSHWFSMKPFLPAPPAFRPSVSFCHRVSCITHAWS